MTLIKSRIKTALMAGAAAGLMLGMSACGKQGDLETAPPLWGDRAKAEVEAKKQAQAQGKATERALPKAEFKNEMEDPYQENKKVSDAPIEGTGNSQRQ